MSPQHCSVEVCLSEITLNVSRALSELGLGPLDSESEGKIRTQFVLAIVRWENPYPRWTFEREELRRLKILADLLNLTLHHFTGFKYAHNVPTCLLQKRLARERTIGTSVAAYFFLDDLNEKLRIVSRAVRDVETTVEVPTPKRGPRSFEWYDNFVIGVLLACERNNIKPTISTNRTDWKHGGRFLEIAERLEQTLPIEMRSPNREALVQRLKRSQRRIKKGPTPADRALSTLFRDSFLC